MKKNSNSFYIFFGLLGLLMVFLFIILFYQKVKLDEYKILVKNYYEKEFHLAVEYITDINILMNKHTVLDENSEEIEKIYANIWAKSQNAHNSIASLPYNMKDVEKLLTCLGQVSDLSYSMFIKTLNNIEIKEEEKNNLIKVSGYINDLLSEINRQLIIQDLQGGGKWEEVMKVSFNQETEIKGDKQILGSISNISNQFVEYPSLLLMDLFLKAL